MRGLISHNNNYVKADQGLLFNGSRFPVREEEKDTKQMRRENKPHMRNDTGLNLHILHARSPHVTSFERRCRLFEKPRMTVKLQIHLYDNGGVCKWEGNKRGVFITGLFTRAHPIVDSIAGGFRISVL